MGDWRIQMGLLLGLAIFGSLSALGVPGAGTDPRAELLSDCDGQIEELVIHYLPEAAPIVVGAYRDLLAQLPAGVRVHAICPDQAACQDLAHRLGPLADRIRPLVVNHPVTPWSRDRWLALAPSEPGAPLGLLAPREEQAASIWPARAGDQRVVFDLEAALAGRVRARRSQLAFDGGDFVADSHTAFVTPAVLRRNLGVSVDSAEELRERLESLLGRRVVLLDEAPEHHAGMFLMLAGDRTALVGDPGLGREVFAASRPPVANPDWSAPTRQRFNAVAAACLAQGYRVIRMPVVLDQDGRTWLTPLNAIVDQRAGLRSVYMPVYQGAEPLAREATRIYAGLGHTVRPVDCTGAYRHFGSLRCLVGVLGRRAPGQATS